MLTHDLLSSLKYLLSERFGRRFRSVILFGSEARGTAAPDSDIDILVLLEDPINLGVDLDAAIISTYSLQLQVDRSFHFSISSAHAYDAGEYSLYRTCKQEGIAA